jgi:ribosome biogenesis GTPase A
MSLKGIFDELSPLEHEQLQNVIKNIDRIFNFIDAFIQVKTIITDIHGFEIKKLLNLKKADNDTLITNPLQSMIRKNRKRQVEFFCSDCQTKFYLHEIQTDENMTRINWQSANLDNEIIFSHLLLMHKELWLFE